MLWSTLLELSDKFIYRKFILLEIIFLLFVEMHINTLHDKLYELELFIFQIVAANKGHICGTLIYKARSTDFGGTINITPYALTLKPDEYKSFNLSFSSNRKGDFIERIDFVVKESLEVLSLHIKYDIYIEQLLHKFYINVNI